MLEDGVGFPIVVLIGLSVVRIVWGVSWSFTSAPLAVGMLYVLLSAVFAAWAGYRLYDLATAFWDVFRH